MTDQQFSRRVDEIIAAAPGISIADAIALAACVHVHGNPCPDFWHIGE